jgi:hypothetical protein
VTDPGSLLMRDPSREDAIWSIWEQARQATPAQQAQIVRTLTKTGT